jgi:addiction module RelB/DinJ family antitoxin
MLCRKDVATMATKSITVRVDESVKERAEVILEDIGINVTTLFNACLKAVIREQRVPFVLESKKWDEYVREKLEESTAEMADPNSKRYTHEEIFGPLREKYGYKV